MRYLLIVLSLLLCSVPAAMAQVSIGIGLPGVSIGINLPLYPQLVQVPGYPVYYAEKLDSNFFFYDGMYWVYHGDNWYASSWYNGPWGLVGPEYVPLFVLRIPVRYYRNPPGYFRGWRAEAPPRWGEHWGNDWEQRRSGWDRWNRSSAPAPAPLPVYQRQYSGDRYPRVEQQRAIHGENYRYQPRETLVRQHYQEQAVPRAPAPSQREQQGAPRERSSGQQEIQRSSPPAAVQQNAPPVLRSPQQQKESENVRKSAPTQALPQRGGEDVQRAAPTQATPQPRGPAVQEQKQPAQGATQREQPAPKSSQESSPPGKAVSQEPKRRQGPEKEREKTDERGPERTR